MEDHYLLSPCVSVTSPLLDDGIESIAQQTKCVHRWPLLLALAVAVGLTLWMLKTHIGEAILWLAALAGLAENAGPWGIVATMLVLAVWVMALMPISLFEVLVGHVFPLRTALAARPKALAPSSPGGYAQLQRHTRFAQGHPLNPLGPRGGPLPLGCRR